MHWHHHHRHHYGRRRPPNYGLRLALLGCLVLLAIAYSASH